METSGDGFGQKVNGKVKTLHYSNSFTWWEGRSCKKEGKHCCRFIQAKKVEVPDIVMAIHPHLEGEFWGPTVDLLLDENVVTGVHSLWCKFEYSHNVAPLSIHGVQWGTLQASPWEAGLRICQVYFQGDFKFSQAYFQILSSLFSNSLKHILKFSQVKFSSRNIRLNWKDFRETIYQYT